MVCHPTLPIVVSAHEDKYIKFFDVKTGKVQEGVAVYSLERVCVCVGKLIHYMTGHMDSVTGLAIDQLGQYLLSGGE